MSTTTIPEFQLHHRLALALEFSHVDVDDMAESLGVTRTTIYNYMSGARTPKLGMIKQWALRCAIPWQWITEDELPETGPQDGGGVSASVTLRETAGIWSRGFDEIVSRPLLKLAA